MTYDVKRLKKLPRSKFQDLKKRVNRRLRFLEAAQARNREAVRVALMAKDVTSVQSLSLGIEHLRRKKNGLRDLNNEVRILNDIYWKRFLTL